MRSAAMAIDCSPDEQKRLIVSADTSTGSPARSEAMRATFIPCSPSGMAQPRITSSISLGSIWGTRSRARLIATAAISSGRVARSAPLKARPTGVRTADARMTSLIISSRVKSQFSVVSSQLGIPGSRLRYSLDAAPPNNFTLSEPPRKSISSRAASRILAPQASPIVLPAAASFFESRRSPGVGFFKTKTVVHGPAESVSKPLSTAPIPRSIPQGLARLQRELDSLLRLFLAAQRFEALALQVQDVLLAHGRARREIAAAQHFGDLVADFDFVVANEVALPHQVDAHLERRQNVLARGGDIGTHHRGVVAGPYQLERTGLRIGQDALAIHADVVEI